MDPAVERLRATFDAVEYGPTAHDLLRYREDDNDAAVKSALTALAELDEPGREDVFKENDVAVDVLLTYAERISLRALRENSVDVALDGVFARLLVPRDDELEWLRDLRYSTYVASTCGATSEMITQIAGSLDDGLSQALADAIDSLTRISDVQDTGRLIVTSAHGTGVLVLTLPNPDIPGSLIPRGIAPVLSKGPDNSFDPASGVAAIAADVADALESDADVVVHDIVISRVPSSVSSLANYDGPIVSPACLVMNVLDLATGSDRAEIYVADLEDDEYAGEFAQAIADIDPDEIPCAAASVGQFVVLTVAMPDFDDDLEPMDVAALTAAAARAVGSTD
jgi:hypothetical protein